MSAPDEKADAEDAARVRVKSGLIGCDEQERFKDVCKSLGVDPAQGLVIAIRGICAAPTMLGVLMSAAAGGPPNGPEVALRWPLQAPPARELVSTAGPPSGHQRARSWPLGGHEVAKRNGTPSALLFSLSQSVRTEERREEKRDPPENLNAVLDVLIEAQHESVDPKRYSTRVGLVRAYARGEATQRQVEALADGGDVGILLAAHAELVAESERVAQAKAGDQKARDESRAKTEAGERAVRGQLEKVGVAVNALLGGRGVVA